MKNTYKWAIVLLCAVIATLCSQMSFFIITLPSIKHLHILIIFLISFGFLLIQLAFMIHYVRLGLDLMRTVSLVILVFIITFIIQLITNYYIFNNTNTLDDYIGMIIMIIGIIISKTQCFN